MLEGKHIVLGVTGGIAAYKAAVLTRELVKKGTEVHVVMTKNAGEFVQPLTFQVLSSHPVFTDMFRQDIYDINHISLAEQADALVIAPATANVIGKIAAGIADDLLTTLVMAIQKPVVICPAMNVHMYENPIVQENIEKLRAKGYSFVTPGYGALACKVEGSGRLADPADIVESLEAVLTPKDLKGETFLVTAGPTREPFDPVRFITNFSSGKMGYAVAIMARRRGARVILVSGPSSLPPPLDIQLVSVSSAREMRDAVMDHLDAATVVVKAAAVADYRPAVQARQKLKKTPGPMTIELERNPDIIAEIGANKNGRILVGFAMETEDLLENARAKLETKNMDLIVANDLQEAGAGFQNETNVIRIIDREGTIESLPLMSKMEAANRILDRIQCLLAAKT